MVRIAEYSRTATFAWSNDRIPYLVSGTASGTIDADFSNESKLELWSLLGTDADKPSHSVSTDAKFKDLDWSADNKYIAGAMDNGAVEIYEFNSSKQELKKQGSFKNHSTVVRTVKFNSKQNNVLLSGGNSQEIFIWDLNKLLDSKANYQPLTPGVSMSPIDEIHSLSWNKSLAHVFASASNSSFASIWDLKAKKEVIHLSYTSQNTGLKSDFSAVEWHPLNSTRVATATSNDNEPLILVWDLRNSNTPLQTLSAANNQGHGHSKGILSLDWCQQDENLLLSSARDSSVMLWNPQSGEALTEYNTTGNWCFKSKFAPQAPDLFAFATLDGKKIEVQTLQNYETTLDEEVSKTKQQESETDFWNHVSEEKAEIKSTVVHLQAPSWYGNKSASAQWAFGGKLVQVTKDGKGVEVNKPEITDLKSDDTLKNALASKDFQPLINQRLVKVVNETNEEDWNLLEKLSMDGKEEFLKEALELDEEEDEEKDQEGKDGDEFFQKIESNFQPSGSFKIDSNEESVINNILSGNNSKAVSELLKSGSILEAFVVAVTCNDEKLKEDVKDAYFAAHGKESSLSRVLFSSSKKNSDDIVENLDTSQWKYITKSIYNFHANDEVERTNKLLQLGDRLLANKNRQDALVIYIAAGSLDKIATVWLNEFSTLENKIKDQEKTIYEAHIECLTEFVERFTILSNFVGKKQKITNESLISKFLEFINITSATGNFDLALLFLDILPEDNEYVIAEKKRVMVASGKVVDQSQSRKGKYGSHANLASAGFSGHAKQPVNLPPTAAPFAAQTMGGYAPQAAGAVPTPAVPVPQTRNASVSIKSNPYGPAGTNVGTSDNKFNAYAPPTHTQVPVATPVTSSFIPPANPYSNVAAQSLAMAAEQNAMSPNLAGSAPPVKSPSVYSGQTPHLNKKANDGWNDLALPVKEKPQRAKPVTVAPSPILAPATNGAATAVPTKSIGTVFPPTGGNSRVPSSMVSPPPPQKRASRTPSLINIDDVVNARPKAHTSIYAPQTTQAGPAPVAPQSDIPLAPTANPYAPNQSVGSTPLQKPVNPYAPPAQQAGIPSAANPYASQIPSKAPVNAPPPMSSKKAPVGPPPMSSRKKAHEGKTLSHEAASVLDSSKPVQTQPIASELSREPAPVPTSASQTQVPPPVQETPARNTISPIDMAAPAVEQGISAAQQPIRDFFSSELARVTPLTPKEYNKQLKDCDKRLKILFTHLEKNLLSQPTVDKLLHIIELLKEKKYHEAMEVHKDIATNHAEEGGNWLTGVKRLISISEATA
ncbi:Trp-Asp (WD) repeats profile [Nakaseomyces glabratus]|nr:Trp-Asp (WD) repeats profile [Nakaseomyces glabratus]